MKKIILSVIVLLIIFSGCTTTTEKKEKTVIQIPDNQEECLAKGGTWKAYGIFPKEICNLPTTDGGKDCKSSNDCEGSCLAANLTDEERRSLMSGKNQGMKVQGKCTNWLRNFGCMGFVEDGKIDKFICQD